MRGLHGASTDELTHFADGELGSSKTAFSVKFNTVLWVFTTGLSFFIGWWYRKAAVFYLPPGWLGPLAWWMALPFAPKGKRSRSYQHKQPRESSMNDLGSVSVGVWQMACRRVIKVGERMVKNMIGGFRSVTNLTYSNFRCAVPSEPVAVPVEMEASSSASKKSS